MGRHHGGYQGPSTLLCLYRRIQDSRMCNELSESRISAFVPNIGLPVPSAFVCICLSYSIYVLLTSQDLRFRSPPLTGSRFMKFMVIIGSGQALMYLDVDRALNSIYGGRKRSPF